MQASSQANTSSPLQAHWENHPLQAAIFQLVKDGQWITHLFEWIFMYISRLAAYIMTFAVGYMIFYAIESRHALDVAVAHPQFPDMLASLSSEIINVAPELVFPGVVVLCIRSFTARKWLDGWLWLITSIVFATLTMTLLNAFMSGGITKEFLSVMLFWRAGAALFYTVVVAYCGGHGGLDFKTLLRELEEIRVQLDGKNQEVSSVQSQLSAVQLRLSSEQQRVSSVQSEVSSLKKELDTERAKVSSLQDQLDTGSGDVSSLRKDLNAARIQMESLLLQLDTKKKEVEELRTALESGQDWRVDRLTKQLQAEQDRVSSLEQQVEKEQLTVSSVRSELDTERVKVSSLRVQVSSLQSAQVSSVVSTSVPTGRPQVDGGRKNEEGTGRVKVSSEQNKVVELDANRRTRTGQDENLGEVIRQLLTEEPGLSGRAIATKIGCSPTTASRWKGLIEGEPEQSVVNE
jgi:hypothetical protein